MYKRFVSKIAFGRRPVKERAQRYVNRRHTPHWGTPPRRPPQAAAAHPARVVAPAPWSNAPPKKRTLSKRGTSPVQMRTDREARSL